MCMLIVQGLGNNILRTNKVRTALFVFPGAVNIFGKIGAPTVPTEDRQGKGGYHGLVKKLVKKTKTFLAYIKPALFINAAANCEKHDISTRR